MKANLLEYVKQTIKLDFVVEIKIWKLKDERYPLGIKYSLIFVNTQTGEKILMDNHFPKNPHLHIKNLEIDYDFKGVDCLINDFKSLVFKYFGEKI